MKMKIPSPNTALLQFNILFLADIARETYSSSGDQNFTACCEDEGIAAGNGLFCPILSHDPKSGWKELKSVNTEIQKQTDMHHES